MHYVQQWDAQRLKKQTIDVIELRLNPYSISVDVPKVTDKESKQAF